MITVAELGGFLLPVVIITYYTWKMRKSLQEFQSPPSEYQREIKGFVDGPYVCSGVHRVLHSLPLQLSILYDGETTCLFKLFLY